MTHVSASTSLRMIKCAGIAIGVAGFTQLLIACTSTNSINFPSLTNTSAENTAVKKVAIAQLTGAPPKVATGLSDAMVKTAGERKLSLSKDKNSGADYLMLGYLVAASDKKGTKLTYMWDVTDAQGKRAHRIKGEELISATQITKGTDPWTLVDDKIINSVATKTTARLASWLPTQSAPDSAAMAIAKNTKSPGAKGTSSQTTTASIQKPSAKNVAKRASSAVKKKMAARKVGSTAKTPNPTMVAAPRAKPKAVSPVTAGNKLANNKAGGKKVLAIVPTVLGAPGDGQSSLTDAIKEQLNQRGVVLANSAQKAAYTVRGEVKLSPASQTDKQDIAIEWRVIDPTGRKLGTVSQRNSIPKGSLNGAWGRTAEAAASAAAEGIVKLLPKKEQ